MSDLSVHLHPADPWGYDPEAGHVDPDEISTLRMIDRLRGDYASCSPAWPVHTLQGCPCWQWIVLRRLQARQLISGSRRRGWRLTTRGERLLAGCRRDTRSELKGP